MKFISLVDISSKNVITVDADSLILRLEIGSVAKEIRLKKYHREILYALFNQHPRSLGYDEITELLKTCNLLISDDTRLHRKISEIRNFLAKFHPSLADIIVNTRGVGYGLPLRFRNLPDMANDNGIKFKNAEINESISIISELIEDAIHLTAHGKIIRNFHGYVMERDTEILEEKISIFNECEKTILQQIRMHEADFIFLRAQYLLAKLKTYVGLARISAYAISKTQWLDWFKSEIYTLFDDLKKTIKEAENA
jgi:DNA-binding winged helix-turn-helix (wHTH) protein